MTDEPLLVVPTDWLGALQLATGFSPDYRKLFDGLASAKVQVVPRSRAEEDRHYKQLVGYVIFRSAGRIFHYQRSQRVGESRLAGLRSVGIGGHVNAEDVGGHSTPEALAAAIRREVAEEVFLDAIPEIRYVGIINSDLDAVGQVHLGIVAVADLPEPTLTLRDHTLADGRFDTLATLAQRLPEFETWSRLCLEFLATPPAPFSGSPR